MVRGIVIKSKLGLSLTTGTESANQVSGATYDYVEAGTLTLFAKGSATGMQFSCFVNARLMARNQDVPSFGTTGTMSTADNWVWSAGTLGGRVELYFNNPTGGTLTVDYLLVFDGVPFGGILSRLAGRRR